MASERKVVFADFEDVLTRTVPPDGRISGLARYRGREVFIVAPPKGKRLKMRMGGPP